MSHLTDCCYMSLLLKQGSMAGLWTVQSKGDLYTTPVKYLHIQSDSVPGIPREGQGNTRQAPLRRVQNMIHTPSNPTPWPTLILVRSRAIYTGRWTQRSEEAPGTTGKYKREPGYTNRSTTIQWGTLLQHGLKYCQDPSAMMSRRCVCAGVRIRRTQKNRRLPGEHSKNSMPGQPLMNHDSTNTVVGKVCLTHMCDPLICYRNVYIYLYICYWCWNIDRFTMILLETKKGM